MVGAELVRVGVVAEVLWRLLVDGAVYLVLLVLHVAARV